MQTAFVTGANGFLGLNIVEQLGAAGWRVVGLCQPGTELRHARALGIEIAEGDILDPAALQEAIPDGADAAFHTAASTSIWSRNNAIQRRVNVDGTRNVLDACLRRHVRCVVHTSTWNTFSCQGGEIDETTAQAGGRSWINYVRTKYLAEAEVRSAVRQGLRAVMLNPAHLMGRYDRRNWGRMFRMVATRRLPGVPDGGGSFCHAEAVAKAHLAAVRKGRSGENYLLPGVEASFAEVIAIISELTGQPAPKRILSPLALKIVARLKTWKAALTGHEPDLTPEGVALMLNDPRIVSHKAEQDLGYRAVPLRVMLEDAYAWLRAEGVVQ